MDLADWLAGLDVYHAIVSVWGHNSYGRYTERVGSLIPASQQG